MTPVNTLTDQIIADEGQTIVQTYRRAPFVLVHGEGMNLYDSEGNAYLDWGSGLAVNALGYGDAELNDVISRQMANGLIHVSNLYHTAPQVQLASALVEKSFADRVFFCNSGTEANEAALKFARKLARTQGGEGKHELVTFTGGFHGRTMGALALTPRDKYQQPFAPMMPGVRVAEFNNLESAKAAIGPNTAAVFVELVQGEGGVNVADVDFIKGLRALCDEFGAVLVFDEIQCGMGRTGTLWAYEQFGVTPDIMTLAKPLAAGLPIGAVLATERVASVMEPGDHGSTFAGGPLVTAVAAHVVERVSSADFLTQVQETGTYLLEQLQEINSPLIENVRGMGLMAGVELNVEAGPLIARGYEQGLIMLNAGPNVLRFLPPLIAEKSHVDTLIDRLVPLLQEAQVQA